MQPIRSSFVPVDGMPVRRWLSPAEAANYTGISKSWMAKLRMHGVGPAYAKLGKAVRYSVESLDAWMSEHARRSTLDPARGSGKSGD